MLRADRTDPHTNNLHESQDSAHKNIPDDKHLHRLPLPTPVQKFDVQMESMLASPHFSSLGCKTSRTSPSPVTHEYLQCTWQDDIYPWPRASQLGSRSSVCILCFDTNLPTNQGSPLKLLCTMHSHIQKQWKKGGYVLSLLRH